MNTNDWIPGIFLLLIIIILVLSIIKNNKKAKVIDTDSNNKNPLNLLKNEWVKKILLLGSGLILLKTTGLWQFLNLSNWSNLLTFLLLFGALIYFHYSEDKSDKSIKKWIVWLVVICALYNFLGIKEAYSEYGKVKAIENTPYILREIAECNKESGDFQIDEDGKFPALTKFKKEGTAPWSDSVECWTKNLKFENDGSIEIIIEAPLKEWSGKIFRPKEKYKLKMDWVDINQKSKFQVEFTITDVSGNTKTEIREYPSLGDTFYGVDSMRLQSTDTKPHNIKVIFSKN